MQVSFFATLTTGQHIVWTGNCSDEKLAMRVLTSEIVAQVKPHLQYLDRFVFAYGRISQQYTPGEVKTEFCKTQPKLNPTEQFILLAQDDVAFQGSNEKRASSKEAFHKGGRQVLKELAKHLGLSKGDYDIKNIMGGYAVTGEVILHTDHLYIQFGHVMKGKFMWRLCRGRNDHSGGQNRWELWDSLYDMDNLAHVMNRAINPDQRRFDKR